MNVWIFLFFFAIAVGLVVLFVVGTSCGVSQRISHEDACDPYAPKEKKPEVQPALHLLKKNDLGVPCVTTMFSDMALAQGDPVRAFRVKGRGMLNTR